MPRSKLSAGILLYRRRETVMEILLIHPGGPLWRNKDLGAWMIPKGLVERSEDLLTTALREFGEETGEDLSGDGAIELPPIRQAGGKTVIAFAIEGDFDPGLLSSNMFEMEWPPRSGRRQSYPEVDEARWFSLSAAGVAMLPSQLPLLEHLAALVD